MPLSTQNLNWLSHNSVRRYPLADNATPTDETDSFELPDDFLVGLDLPTHAGMNVSPDRFYIKHIGAYATGYSVFVGYAPADDSTPITVATASIPRQTHTKNTAYALGGIGDYADTVGKVVIGKLDNIDEQPPGFWTFDFAATRLDPDAIRPIIRGVSAVIAVNQGQRSAPIRGDIELVAGTNMQIVASVSSGVTTIRFNAIQGEGTVETCVCEGEVAVDPIVSVNGIRPTPDGNFTVVGSDCLQVEAIANGIRLVDTCSAPCCGCAELERITQDLERFSTQAARVEDFVESLRNNVDTMSLTVLGAKLSDRGCATC